MRIENDVVRLKRAVHGVSKGSTGTILMVLSNAEPITYLMEFTGESVFESKIIEITDEYLD